MLIVKEVENWQTGKIVIHLQWDKCKLQSDQQQGLSGTGRSIDSQLGQGDRLQFHMGHNHKLSNQQKELDQMVQLARLVLVQQAQLAQLVQLVPLVLA